MSAHESEPSHLLRTSIDTDYETNTVFLALSESATAEDYYRLHAELLQRYGGKGFSACVDTSALTFRAPMIQVRSLAGLEPVFDRIAIIAPEELKFGMARAYETLASLYRDRPIAVFRTRQEAIQWLRR
jgi:hypothetical protein